MFLFQVVKALFSFPELINEKEGKVSGDELNNEAINSFESLTFIRHHSFLRRKLLSWYVPCWFSVVKVSWISGLHNSAQRSVSDNFV